MNPPIWRQIQKTNITSFEELSSFLLLNEEQLLQLDVTPRFVLNLPRRIAEKMAKSDISDPLFVQFVPLIKEREKSAGFVSDPVQDTSFVKEHKLLQKYKSRVLLVTTGACAMHCRFCFRQNYPYETENKTFTKDLELIGKDTSIEEVILSGGDPLSLSDTTLQALLNDLQAISHVKRIRFHTRFPIGIPERIDDNFLAVLQSSSKQIWFVMHSNHLNEYDDDIWKALKRLQCLGIPVLNQTVLLKGVNDSVETLQQFFTELVNHGITPYYLHQLDRVQGAAHFEVPITTGKALIQELTSRLSGYAVPKYVQEIAGRESKTAL